MNPPLRVMARAASLTVRPRIPRAGSVGASRKATVAVSRKPGYCVGAMHILVNTGGGDAPGLNAVIRAVTLSAPLSRLSCCCPVAGSQRMIWAVAGAVR